MAVGKGRAPCELSNLAEELKRVHFGDGCHMTEPVAPSNADLAGEDDEQPSPRLAG